MQVSQLKFSAQNIIEVGTGQNCLYLLPGQCTCQKRKQISSEGEGLGKQDTLSDDPQEQATVQGTASCARPSARWLVPTKAAGAKVLSRRKAAWIESRTRRASYSLFWHQETIKLVWRILWCQPLKTLDLKSIKTHLRLCCNTSCKKKKFLYLLGD